MAARMNAALRLGSALMGAGWELRRRAYARGLRRQSRVEARVVSVGNLSVGGTGKTTLTLHLARRALALGLSPAVVCRRYRPGPGGRADEELMLEGALGAGRVFAGASKLAEARRAAAGGFALLLVDDGFSHWPLARDFDIVLIDARDWPSDGALLPAGRLREPLRALQRAGALVVSRLANGEDPAPWLERARELAPGSRVAAGRHRVSGLRALEGAPCPRGARVRVLTGTGNPRAVEASAREGGCEVVAVSTRRDHHWFGAAEARAERAEARRQDAWVLLTAKDAVRWPADAGREGVAVLEVAWEWAAGGEEVERLALAGEDV